MYIKRNLRNIFRTAFKQFPAILITGPRQSGKTTFLKNELDEKTPYVSFDDPMERSFVKEDPVGFIERFKGKSVILDEIQYVPELFSYIKIDIDNNRQTNGKWIMTGSQQFNLMKDISDTLAGRIAILNLLPFHTMENIDIENKNIENIVWYGGYPENILYSDKRDLWFSSYIQTYVERDVRQLLQVQDLNTFQTFLGICASVNSQELNIASISRHIGITQPTCKKWISILSASFIVLLIKPYFNNFGKRLIKSPKLYFLDQAMAVYMTRQPDPFSMFNGSMGGAFFEGFVITEVFKILNSMHNQGECYFWRSHEGLEVDLLINKNGITWPIEIKKTATPTSMHCKSLNKFTQIAKGIEIGTPKIVCTVKEKKYMPHGIEAVPWKDFLRWVSE